MSQTKIPFSNGVIIKEGFDSKLKGYILKKDNPAHCFQIFFGESLKGTVCIYPDEIAIIPDGMDGFSVPFQNPIPYKVFKELDQIELDEP